MGTSLAFSPSGHLVVENEVEDELGFSDIDAAALLTEVPRGEGAILLWLAAKWPTDGLPPTAMWWREMTGWYLSEFCRCGGREGMSEPDSEAWADFLERMPPMRGAEFLTLEALQTVWRRLDAAVDAEIASDQADVEAWLQRRLPHWHLVGRVTLHLAENKKSLDRPFAFLATYTSGLNDQGKPRHLPLQQAVKEFAGKSDRTALLHLLEPLSLAAAQSEWARKMTEGSAIYQAHGWSPGQALAFLREVPLLESCGLRVRIPNWWKSSAPPRPKVQVTVDSTGGAPGVNVGGLLQFRIDLSLNGEKLTAEELKALRTAEGLALVKGHWVEVNPEKLQAVFDHWQQARMMQYQGGMSFLQAMRLLAGIPASASGDGRATPTPEDLREWSAVEAGPALADLLRKMRDPAALQEFSEHPDLRATLRPYQQAGVNWLRFMTRLGLGACLADDMGLGKTIQVLALLLQVKRLEPDGGPTLLVAPASLVPNWKAEAEKFAPTLRTLVAHASGDEPQHWGRLLTDRMDGLDQVDLVITTYGMVSRLPVLKDITWRLLVLDEAQAIKNASSLQARAVKSLTSAARIALTGTPVENRLGDLWSLFDFLNPGLLGDAATFQRLVKSLSHKEGMDFAPLRRLVKPCILRRLKTDKSIIRDLPDKTEVVAWCSLTKPQAVLYQQAVNALAATLAEVDRESRSGLVLAALMTFKQICNHPAQHSGDTFYDSKQSGKFLRLKELCESIAERQERVLVFTQFTEIIPALRGLLREVFRRDGLVLTGSTPVEQRRQLVEEFQTDQGPPFFILSLKAGGTGLTLTAASQVIHFDRWWNPAVENQATDRAYRIGQKRKVLVHKFVCRGTLEEKIDRLILGKKGLADGVLSDGVERSLAQMSDAELLDFVSLEMNQPMERA
jgi:superfamily II DNA or RNA helicase